MSITEAAASVAARAFFYPSLAWNIARNRLQETWHWWDEITETVLLGALPFYSTLEQLKELGVTAVVTLNEEFEVFITPEQYQDSGLNHLHLPTVDFLYAPPLEGLHRGADFIHETGAKGGKTYVHCKAGRGRSTTLVLCYLIKYRSYQPVDAYKFVRERRPQVYLAQGQWTAVCSFYISCHGDEKLSLEDFPYPTFLPMPSGKLLVPELPQLMTVYLQTLSRWSCAGKQGSDGPEPGPSDLSPSDTSTQSAAEEPVSTSESGTDKSCSSIEASNLSFEEGLKEPDVGRRQREGLGEEGSRRPTTPKGAQSQRERERCGADVSGSAVQITVSTPPANGDKVVLLSGLPAEHCDSESSIGNIATALTTCCLDPRASRRHSRTAETLTPAEEAQAPERAASPAIEIPRIRAAQPEPTTTAAANSKGSINFERSLSSKGSIQLEPSGSLPGYIRIAPMKPMHKVASESSMQKTPLCSIGFNPIEDWAAVDGSNEDI